MLPLPSFRGDQMLKKLPKKTRIFLMNLAKANGGILTVAAILAAAKPASSPIHSYFEWDNTRAAEAYRKMQARSLVQLVVAKTMDTSGEDTSVNVRLLYSLPEDRATGGGYRLTTDIIATAESRRKLLASLVQDLRRVEMQLSIFTEYAQTRTKLSHLIKELDTKAYV